MRTQESLKRSSDIHDAHQSGKTFRDLAVIYSLSANRVKQIYDTECRRRALNDRAVAILAGADVRSLKVAEFPWFSVRLLNVLRFADICTIDELLILDYRTICVIPNFGRKLAKEIIEVLSRFNLRPGWADKVEQVSKFPVKPWNYRD